MRLRYLLPSALALELAGCAPTEEPSRMPEGLIGYWEWSHSEGDDFGRIRSPTFSGYRFAIEFQPDGGYTEYRNDRPSLQGRYRVRDGRTFNTRDTIVPLIQLDSSRVFNIPFEFSVAVHSISPDTLVLFGTDSEADYYTLVRAKKPYSGERP